MKAIDSYLYIVVRETKKRVSKTKYFMDLGPIKKKMILTKMNLKGINQSLKTINEIGFNSWLDKTQTKWDNIEIIKELCKQ